MPAGSASTAPFHLDLPPVAGGALRRAAMAWAQPALERLLGLPDLNDLYAGTWRSERDAFSAEALQRLRVTLDVDEADLARVPASGPLVVVANHPFGGVDGLALHALLRRVRPDVKLLGNYLLHRIPELRDTVIPVDPFGGGNAIRGSVRGLKAARRWIEAGGCLAVFPAGEVSHLQLGAAAITDPAWSSSIARLARRAGAAMLPVHFAGANGALFQLAGLVHPRLRTALLPRELLRRQATSLSVRIGRLVPAPRVAAMDDETATTLLRARTYMLARDVRPSRQTPPRSVSDRPRRFMRTVAAPVADHRLAAEVASLPESCWLGAQGAFRVGLASASQMPMLLDEIGRLREITFRAAGEGTGRKRDLDAFDAYYRHLFVWHVGDGALAGAYRLGLTDEIVAEHGPAGLYTQTLFRYDQRLLDRLSPAIELGRSFVRAEYQRDYAPLLLLWKGIGRFVVTHPRYRRLFGPVTISHDYSSVSKHLLMAFLEANRRLPDLARLVAPRHPPPVARRRDEGVVAGRTAVDFDEADALVADIEADGRGLPVLLRQYLKLNARLLGWNVDRRFGRALDGLMLVDLVDVPRPLLSRYLGKDGASTFLAAHGAGDLARASSVLPATARSTPLPSAADVE
ncbi:MAG: GNAT family N-acyltransferase [Vicinamibacteraceae bacterium]